MSKTKNEMVANGVLDDSFLDKSVSSGSMTGGHSEPPVDDLFKRIDLGTRAIAFPAFFDFASRNDKWENVALFGTNGYSMLKGLARTFLLEKSAQAQADADARAGAGGAGNGRSGGGGSGGDGDGSPPRRIDESEVAAAEKNAEAAYQTFIDTLNGRLRTQSLPYFHLISGRVATMPPKLLWKKMSSPLMLELIHSYWLEQGLLVQTIDAITARYANVRLPPDGRARALYRLEIEPLRRVNNIIWGYIEDTPHRLTVARRAAEYGHAYGLTLHGRPALNTADPRTQFRAAFHNLLYRCLRYFEQTDDRQVRADPQGVFNSLKEVQLILGEGAHNQFGELPFEARADMLVQQWILAQPEISQYLGGRAMTPYPEAWMDRIDTVKGMLGVQGPSVIHHAELAQYGERILLGVRYGNWTANGDRLSAGTWATAFRNDIQGYVHAYRAVTGTDLEAVHVDATPAFSRGRRALNTPR